jgi:RND family efflux transporter MFP subunit
MNAKPYVIGLVLLGVGVAVGALGARWFSDHAREPAHAEAAPKADESADVEPEGAALVLTEAVIEETLSPVVEAIGSTVIPPSGVTVVSLPSEVTVLALKVVPGQAVDKDAVLLQFAPSPDAALQLALAEKTAESTAQALETAKARVERGLATKPEQIAAQAAADEARQRLERLRASRPPTNGLLRAPLAGVVQAVHAQAGGVTAANTPLVDVAPPAASIAQVGVEPGQAEMVAVGQHASVTPLSGGDGSWPGLVRLIAPSVDGATRLVNVNIDFEGEARPKVGTMLRARFAVPGRHVLTISRAALLADDPEAVLVVRDEKAVRVPVKFGLRTGERVEVKEGLSAGDQVIVLGQWQVKDGAHVRLKSGGEH